MVGYLQIFVKRKFLLYSFILMLVGLLVYYPALSAGFVLDDEGQIVHNEIIKSFSHFPLFFTGGTFYGGDSHKLIGGFYRPIMNIVYATIYAIGGMNPFPYHFFSVLLHCVNAVLVYAFFRWILKSARETLLPFLLALVFLVHPMLVSGVAYVAAVNEPLFFFFGMLGLLIIMYRPLSLRTLTASTTLFLLGLLSKETTILFTAVAYIYLQLFERKKTRRFIIAMIMIVIVYILMRCGVAHMCDGRTGIGPLATMSLDRYILQLPAIVFFYLYTFLFPVYLAISQEWIIRQATLTTFYLPLAVCAGVAIASLGYLFYFYYKASETALTHKRDDSRLPKSWVLTLSIFILGILMHMHIIPLDFTVDEHWFYFSIVGLLGMTGILLHEFLLKRHKRIIYMTLIIWATLLAYRTYLRTQDWHDNYRLFSHDIRYSSDSAALANNLATELFREKNYHQAKRYYSRATQLDPDRPVAWTNLGIIAELENQDKEAKHYYLTAINKGRYYKAYELYAALLIKNGETKKAKTFINETALPLFPHNPVLLRLSK